MAKLTVRAANVCECSVCGQLLDPEQQEREGREMVLLGAAKYAWCASCGRQVPAPWTAAYRANWDVFQRDRTRDERRSAHRPASDPSLPSLPYHLVHPDGVSVYIILVVLGSEFIVRELVEGGTETDTHFASMEDAVASAASRRARFFEKGYRDQAT